MPVVAGVAAATVLFDLAVCMSLRHSESFVTGPPRMLTS